MRRWKELIRGTAAVLAAVVLAGAGVEVPARAEDSEPAVDLEWKIVDNKAPEFKYQQSGIIEMEIKNNGPKEEDGPTAIEEVVVEVYIKDDEEMTKWPFKKEYQDDERKLKKIETGKSGRVSFDFTERDDIGSGNHPVYFKCTYTLGGSDKTESIIKRFWVRTTAKPEEKKEDKPLEVHVTDKTPKEKEDDEKKKEKKETIIDPPFGEEGGFSNGEPSYSGGGGGGEGGGDGTVPRVIVTGFDTKPINVKAGTDFTLIVHLKNTSKKTRVKNMLFDLNAPEEGSDEQTTAPAFLPSSGSSSIYLEGMRANGTADISIKLNAKSDLLQKPYSVELSMKYEDASANAVEATSSLSIPVKQDARFEFSDFEINPESVSVDDEANVMCNLYNLGRIKLYNVRATFEGNCIEKEEVFVGNVESGATASIDAMLKGTQPTQGPEPVTMTMSYENEEGEATTEQKELMLEVTEGMDEGMDVGEIPMEEEASGGLPIVPIVIAIGILAMAAAAVIILKERKKRKRKSEEEDFLYELDGSSEDEQ